MDKFFRTFHLILSLPKTIIFNFYYFKFKDAIKLPVLVSKDVVLKSMSGKIELEGELIRGIIQIGFGDLPLFDRKRSKTIWNLKGGTVIFKGKCFIGHGSYVGIKGKLILGNNFRINAESKIICNSSISFGDNVLISWNCQFLDSDFHKIRQKGVIINYDKPIVIGNNVWIGSDVKILKGSVLPNNCVIGSFSQIAGVFKITNTIIAGNPAKVIRENITWER